MIRLVSEDIEILLDELGASIAGVRVPDVNGSPTEVLLSPDAWTCGGEDPSYSGRTVAPCCGRIRYSEISILGKTFKLSENEGVNHIHGGFGSAALSRWETVSAGPDHACFRIFLPDGLDGYPGNRILEAVYTAGPGSVSVHYSAVSDRPTWFDCTNHAYWDLSGRFDGSALGQTLEICSDTAVMNGKDHLPVSLAAVDDAMDFRNPTRISDKLSEFADNEQLKIGNGYNNAFLLKEDSPYAARLFSPVTGIKMTVRTDQPSLVFYSGGFLSGSVTVGGREVPDGAAVALEAQAVPDCGHLENAGNCLLMPGETWTRSIRFEFSTRAERGKDSHHESVRY